MFGLIIAIVAFNALAFKTNKILSKKQVAHVWCFTIACQAVFDIYVDFKYHGYWYFSQDLDWLSLPTIVLLVPPVNIMLLNWYPFKKSIGNKIIYLLILEIVFLGYEILALLPAPWGYFHYGWWNLGYSALLNPFLFVIVVIYFKKFIQ